MLVAAQRAAQDAAEEALTSRSASSGPTASLEAQAIELLEARVIAAEHRAAEAERRLAELGFEGPPNGSNGHVAQPSSGQWAAETEPYAPTVDDPMAFGASNGHRSEPDAPEPPAGQLEDQDEPDGQLEDQDEPDGQLEDQDDPAEQLEDQDEPDGPPVSPISAEASDLRARLARSAARKKRSLEP